MRSDFPNPFLASSRNTEHPATLPQAGETTRRLSYQTEKVPRRETLKQLLTEIRACKVCADLPMGPRPVVAAGKSAKLLVVGQAPGIRVHESGIAWNDPSGNRLRDWMGVEKEVFYDESKVALIPMGFCYPGTGKSGDLPPRPECAPLWHDRLMKQLPAIELTLVLGQYSQRYILKDKCRKNLTETVKDWRTHLPDFLPMPHPSPRNNRWVKNNPWFESDVLPWLNRRVKDLLG